MTAEMTLYWPLLSVILGTLPGRRGRDIRRWPTQVVVVTMLMVEASVGVRALYPTLSPKAGLMLSQDTACHRDTLLFQRALKNRTLWAERMMDASSRGVVGGLWGARFHLGSFDACMSVGATSPVGARYCLATLTSAPQSQRSPRDQGPHDRHRQRVSCDDLAVPTWDQVTTLNPQLNVQAALQGCGRAPGSIPLSDVLVALCVPDSCEAAPLETALQASLGRTASSFEVRVEEEHCTSHTEMQRPQSTAAALFWTLVVVLSVAIVLAPQLGWSAWNWRSHLQRLSQPEAPIAGLDLNAVSGIRLINTVLVMGTHRAFNSARMPTSNQFISSTECRTSMWYTIGHHITMLVETFFFISGMLMALSMSQQRHQSLARSLVSRYLRLTPSYAFMILFNAVAMESVGSGPLWKAITTTESVACRRWWWTNLLYANNYVHGEEDDPGCMLQSWSLAVDMQQFVLGSLLLPLLLPLVPEHPNKGSQARGRDWLGLTLSVGMVAAILTSFLATLTNGWPPMLVWTARVMQQPFAEPLFYSIYVPTHMRAASYVAGVAGGCIMLRLKTRNVKLRAVDSARLTWGSVSVMVALLVSSVVFGDLSLPPTSPLRAALYASLTPALWAIAVGTLIVSLTFGPETAAVGILRWQPMVTLSRLSYGVYLVHFVVQLMQGGAERDTMNVTVSTVFRSGFSDLVLSLIISMWLYLAVEAPLRHLTKTALSKMTWSTSGAKEAGKKRSLSDAPEEPEELPSPMEVQHVKHPSSS